PALRLDLASSEGARQGSRDAARRVATHLVRAAARVRATARPRECSRLSREQARNLCARLLVERVDLEDQVAQFGPRVVPAPPEPDFDGPAAVVGGFDA